jgi:cytochrome bd-type quinol oxidase subunit 2
MSGLMVLFAANATSLINDSAKQACANACNTNATVGSIFAQIANALVFLVGAVSVIMIIIGGLRYVLANGDAKQAASAKDTILYSVIGIVVAIASYAIVTFVTKHIG